MAGMDGRTDGLMSGRMDGLVGNMVSGICMVRLKKISNRRTNVWTNA